jgi:hypothetical protein
MTEQDLSGKFEIPDDTPGQIPMPSPRDFDAIRELYRIRATARSRILRPFFQRVETWELLLIIYSLEGDGSCGIEDYLDRLQTLKVTRITMRNFIKDRIGEASIFAVTGDKKSRKSLVLSEELRRNLEAYFEILKLLKDRTRSFEGVNIDTTFVVDGDFLEEMER